MDIRKAQNKNLDEPNSWFKIALERCLDVRSERSKVYGDIWYDLKHGINMNFWGGMYNKMNRMTKLIEDPFASHNYETFEDTLKDMVILTLFTYANYLAIRDAKNRKS